VQDPFAEPLRIAFAATRKLDDPYRDGFALASRGLRKPKRITRLIERVRHRTQRLGIEYGLTSDKWKENTHPVLITGEKDSRLASN
jgi:hypothetical protein